jgi:hypothetical protein
MAQSSSKTLSPEHARVAREAYSIAVVRVCIDEVDFGHIPATAISSQVANTVLQFARDFGHDAGLLSERALASLREKTQTLE